MFLEELRAKRSTIESLVLRYGAQDLRVFGSVARGQEGPDSDVDVLVSLPQGYDLFNQRIPLTDDLAALLQRRVDLIPEHELSVHLRDRVLSEAVRL